MQKHKFFTLFFLVISSLWAVSCSDDDSSDPDPLNGALSQKALQYIQVSQEIDLFFGMVDNMVSNNVGGRESGRKRAFPGKKLSFGNPFRITEDDYLPECITYSFTENPDGSFTTIVDYGTACLWEGVTYSGKMTEIYRASSDDPFTQPVTYSSTILMENFGIDDMKINGSFQAEGTFSMVVQGNEVYFNSSSSNEQAFTILFGNKAYTVSSQGTSEAANQLFTVKTRNQQITFPDGSVYQMTVVSPLVYDDSCSFDDGQDDDDSENDDDYYMVYVKGIQNHTFPGGTVSFDFGDGTCDTKVTVTENGKSTEVEIGDLHQ